MRLFCTVSPLTVHDEGEVVGVVELVGCDQPGPIGPNPGNDLPRLNCGTGGRICTCAGEVLADGQPGNVCTSRDRRNLVGEPPDDDDQFDLPVDDLAGSSTVAYGPVMHDGNFVNVGGNVRDSTPASAAWAA